MVLTRMKDAKFDFSKVAAVSGTGQVLFCCLCAYFVCVRVHECVLWLVHIGKMTVLYYYWQLFLVQDVKGEIGSRHMTRPIMVW